MTSKPQIFRLSPSALLQSEGEFGVIWLDGGARWYTCNESATAFLSRLDGSRSVEDVALLLVEEFEVDSGQIVQELSEFAIRLENMNILVR